MLDMTSEKNRILVQIERKKREGSGIYSFVLRDVSGKNLPAFSPGSHINLYLKSGLIRQYSICSDPMEMGFYKIAVLLADKSRGGSREVHQLEVGDKIEISPPLNDFPLADEQEEAVLIAGGIGITPLMSMAIELARNNTAFMLHYLARSKTHSAFRKELPATLGEERISFRFDDKEGMLTEDEILSMLGPAQEKRHVYVCGPEGLITTVERTAQKNDWQEDNIHYERFGADPALATGKSVTIKLAHSGQEIIGHAHQSLAQSLIDAGISIQTSCERGICGTCVVPLLEGTAEHRDSYLSKDEKESMTKIALCCSRAITDYIIIDV